MKKFLIGGLFAIAACAANASYLYWQVTEDDYDAVNWATAKVYWFSGTLTDYPSLSSETAVDNVGFVDAYNEYKTFTASKSVKPSSLGYVANVGTLDGGSYSFFVELSNSSGQRVGFSNIQTGVTSDSSYLYASTDKLTTSLASELANVQPWHATSYGPVPEPTSAMLMLFGAAFLGLKRKNRRIA